MNKQRKSLSVKLRLAAWIAAISVSAVFLTAAGNKNFEITKQLDIFSTMFQEVVVNYVDEVNVSDMMKSGIDGMLSTLDPYTTFIPESQIEDVRFMTTGQYGGIGAVIRTRNDHMMIVEPYQGFPAHQAGLIPGDIILEINGQSVKGLDSDETRNLLTGQPGTSVDLLIEREEEETPLEFRIEREVVQVDNIPHYDILDDGIAYIKLSNFTRNAGPEVRDALQELREENDVEGVIIDLRGNGGGLLNEAVNISNLFIDKNQLVVNTKARIEERNTRHNTLNDPLDTEIPLAIVVDNASASASEIVAGAMQDYDRGVVIGDRTFGKGLVQNVLPLSYNTRLKVTVAEYLIPSGRSIQAIDYAERREDGSVAKIPDSLKQAYETRNGRIVYDGGGIAPDLDVEKPEPAQVTQNLIRQYMIFDYASEFYRQHDTIPEPASFVIDDDIYEDFLDFVERQGFDYDTQSEKLLKELQDVTAEEKYHDAVVEEIKRLEETIRQEKGRDFVTFREEIEQRLRAEIVSRYYYQKGQVIVSLDTDPDVEEALEILGNRQAYEDVLTP